MEHPTMAQELDKALTSAIASKDLTEVAQVLKSIREDLSWLFAYSDAVTLKKTVSSAAAAFSSDEELRALVEKVLKTLTSVIQPFELLARDWWAEPEKPVSPTVSLLFRDVTATSIPNMVVDDWETISVDANLQEEFRVPFFRFRARGNRKHRHPLCPSWLFEIVVPSKTQSSESEGESKTELLPSEDAGKHTVRAVLDLLHLDPEASDLVVRYVRWDNRNWHLNPVDRVQKICPWLRLLPDWYVDTPSTWISPVPPPSLDVNSVSDPRPTGESYRYAQYFRIPSLKLLGMGRSGSPEVTVPPFVVSHIYVPTTTSVSQYGVAVNLGMILEDESGQLVRIEDKTPLPLTDEQAKSLLGRIIQYGIEPLPAPSAKPKKKKARKSVLTEFCAVAWGYDSSTRLLHCAHVIDTARSAFCVDLGTTGSHTSYAPSTKDAFSYSIHHAHWIGLVTTPDDKRALAQMEEKRAGAPATVPETVEPPKSAGALALKLKELDVLVEKINSSGGKRVLQVEKPSDTLMFGDVQLSKEGLDFELTVNAPKPGHWRISEESEIEIMLALVDQAAPGPQAGEVASQADELEWEELGSFSIDSGVASVFLASAFEAGGALYQDGADGESATILESLMDYSLEHGGDQRVLVVPGGMIFSADDGGYTVEGRRNADGELVAIRIQY